MNAGLWFTQLTAWQVMAVGLAFFGALYLLGGWGMTALTRMLARRQVGKVLDTRALQPDQLQREWCQSAMSVLLFGSGMVVPWGLLQLGWAQLAPTASAARVAAEIVVLMVWNDVHFWLNHRLLHAKALVRFHGDHHRSYVTTPWSTYSFHPLEALMLGNIILLPMLVHDFYFWSLAAVPVLSLVLTFFSAACLFLLLQAEFLGVALILVYVGAVMVLFLFVVMMLDINTTPLREGFARYLPVAAVVAGLMFVQMLVLLGAREEQIESVSLGEEKPKNEGQTEAAYAENRRGDMLYTGEF